MTTNTAAGPLRLGRLGAAMGLFFVAATIAGNELANSGDAAGDSTTTALANVRRVHGLTNHLGLMLEIFGFVALMFFAGYLYRLLRRGEGPDGWLAVSALIAASVDLAVKLGSGAPMAAAFYHSNELTPDLARTLVDLNNGAFIITGLTMAMFTFAVSASAYSSRVLPRTLTSIGLIIAVPGLITPILGIINPANYNPLPYLLALLWITAVGVARIVTETRTHHTTAPKHDSSAATTPTMSPIGEPSS